YQAAVVGARPIENTAFEHVNSRNASVGLGLVVRAAAEAAASGRPFADVVGGGRVPRGKGMLAKLLGILPVLAITPKGTAEPVARARGFDGALRKMMR